MKKLQPFGESWKEIGQFGTFRHDFFYKFLQLSPSYQLAYKKLVKKEIINTDTLPGDFDLVEENFRKFGNVFDSNYIFWWEEIGYRVFEKSNSKHVAFSINTNLSREDLIKQFTELIDQIKNSNDVASHEGIKLLHNKITAHTLQLRYSLVLAKAQFFLNKVKKEQNWTLALLCDLSKKFKGFSQEQLDKTPDSEDNKNYLNILTSKNLKEAYYIAENAARGNFPSLDKIDSGLDFDYRFINKFYESYFKNLISNIRESEKLGENYMKFLDPSKIHKPQKKKSN